MRPPLEVRAKDDKPGGGGGEGSSAAYRPSGRCGTSQPPLTSGRGPCKIEPVLVSLVPRPNGSSVAVQLKYQRKRYDEVFLNCLIAPVSCRVEERQYETSTQAPPSVGLVVFYTSEPSNRHKTAVEDTTTMIPVVAQSETPEEDDEAVSGGRLVVVGEKNIVVCDASRRNEAETLRPILIESKLSPTFHAVTSPLQLWAQPLPVMPVTLASIQMWSGNRCVSGPLKRREDARLGEGEARLETLRLLVVDGQHISSRTLSPVLLAGRKGIGWVPARPRIELVRVRYLT